ncbi:MAG TPA: hypothetical protein VHE99_11780 [Gammaproteobacteria bacterium]|nr:hypothetical protein [Gammaproteobacteria bacterium]
MNPPAISTPSSGLEQCLKAINRMKQEKNNNSSLLGAYLKSIKEYSTEFNTIPFNAQTREKFADALSSYDLQGLKHYIDKHAKKYSDVLATFELIVKNVDSHSNKPPTF